jgi:hypothetical protein
MKEKILEALKTKYSNLGLSKETLDGYADYLALSVTEEEGIADAVAKIEGLLKIQQSENDKIRTATRRKAEEVKKPEAETIVVKDAAKDPEPAPKKEAEGKDNEIPDWAKKLLGKVELLEKRNSERDRQNIIEARRKSINDIVGKLPSAVKIAYDRMNLDIDDDDYEALKTSIASEVETLEKELSQKSAVTKPPLQGGGNGNPKPMSKETADEIAKSLAGN